jgi:hypothetical protein
MQRRTAELKRLAANRASKWVTMASHSSCGRWVVTLAQTQSVAAFISCSGPFRFLAQACCYCSSWKINSPKWWMLYSAWRHCALAWQGFVAVMDAHAPVDGQDADHVGGILARLDVDRIVGGATGAGDMYPTRRARVAHAGLVVMQHRCPHTRSSSMRTWALPVEASFAQPHSGAGVTSAGVDGGLACWYSASKAAR